MIQSFESRQFTNAFDFPESEKERKHFVHKILEPFKFVLIMGLSGSGKSTFLTYYQGRPNWSHTLWNRDTIFDMMWNDGTRLDNFYGKIDKFEADIFPELFDKPYHNVIIEGWNRMRSGRKKYLSMLPQGYNNVAVLVFDGPLDLMMERNIAKGNHLKYGKSEEDLRFFLRDRQDSTQWPVFSEGWSKIYYINTFGQAGAEYLLPRLSYRIP
jgi:hypothetical protein